MKEEIDCGSSQIDYSIKRARSWVLSRIQRDGWFPFAQVQDTSVRGIWCSAQALAGLMLSDTEDLASVARSTVSWLINQRTGKAWASMILGDPLVESTSWVLLTFVQAEKIGLLSKEFSGCLDEGLEWLLDCQNSDGGWGSWKDDLSRVTTSSMVCRVLARTRSRKELLESASTYLRECQNSDGGWGIRKAEKSNVISSSLALSALSELSSKRDMIERGCEFLRNEQNSRGFFAEDLFIHETVAKESGIFRWQYFHLPYVLHALAISEKSHSMAFLKGLLKLLDLQDKSGAWMNPDEPQICYHTYVTLYFLEEITRFLDRRRFLEFRRVMNDFREKENEARITAQKNRLKQEIVNKALIVGEKFTLASGKESSFYYNLKNIVLDPQTVDLIANLIWELSADIQADAIGGPETGAIPIAVAVAEKSLGSEFPLKAFFIRKEAKGHGTKAFIEGPLKKGDRVILVEDVTTTGQSVLRSIEKIHELSCEIVRIYSVVDREEGADKNLGLHSHLFYPLFRHSEVRNLV
jgi:orotate phosphoribosyltransferase